MAVSLPERSFQTAILHSGPAMIKQDGTEGAFLQKQTDVCLISMRRL